MGEESNCISWGGGSCIRVWERKRELHKNEWERKRELHKSVGEEERVA